MSILQRTILAVAIASSALPAMAGSPTAPVVDGKPTMAVKIHDLDLHDARDIHRLKGRIANAVEAVCGSYLGSEEGEREEIARCRHETTANLPQPIIHLLSRPARQADLVAAASGGPTIPVN
jgi:UrcA family protein